MMATLFRIDQPARLVRLAVKIGADVPFFLNPVPARVTGIGEQLAPFGKFAQFALVVAVPPIEVPTAAVFRDLEPRGLERAGIRSRRPCDRGRRLVAPSVR